MNSKPGRDGSYVADCDSCSFRAHGSEAYCRRKGAAHARRAGHHITVGDGGAQ